MVALHKYTIKTYFAAMFRILGFSLHDKQKWQREICHTFFLGLHMRRNCVVGRKSWCGCPRVWELNSIFMQTCFFLRKLPLIVSLKTIYCYSFHKNASCIFHCNITWANTAWQVSHGYEGESYVILRLFEVWPWFTENTKPQQSHRRLFLNCPSSVKVALTLNLSFRSPVWPTVHFHWLPRLGQWLTLSI